MSILQLSILFINMQFVALTTSKNDEHEIKTIQLQHFYN